MLRRWFYAANETSDATPRTVSRLLWAGIAVLPVLFVWLTLRKGHSSLDRNLACAWLVIFLALLLAPTITDEEQLTSFGSPGSWTIDELFRGSATADDQSVLDSWLKIRDGGEETAVQRQQAFKVLYQVAKKGNASAMFFVGQAYERGYGVDKNLDNAKKWFLKGAQRGDASAQWGISQYSSFEEKMVWLKKAADQGDRTARLEYENYQSDRLEKARRYDSHVEELTSEVASMGSKCPSSVVKQTYSVISKIAELRRNGQNEPAENLAKNHLMILKSVGCVSR